MTAMVKQGEVHRVDNNGEANDRPRVIWNPSETVQLFVTAFNSVLI